MPASSAAVAAQVSETTVRKGVDELEAGEEPLGRVRRAGCLDAFRQAGGSQ
ncbi:hypothetical protein [Streptomyces neyagawaensis]|uniref:hypothetical protein n=1 Tax=Streptomyces neyagawaensis TaxID=42238 RepID=UPI000A53B342|nr:hypothetical protein [Streptomyces neyagawaensis]MCL6738533.1 hypothetical protein [Streptomyces neyagawaensis]MDE1688933.1 hypothetical protein [Streptomyces neyagawaensis]